MEKLDQPSSGDHLQPRPLFIMDITQQWVTSGGRIGVAVRAVRSELIRAYFDWERRGGEARDEGEQVPLTSVGRRELGEVVGLTR